MSRGWLYNIQTQGNLRVKLIPPLVAGSRGIFWVLADDGECYGVEAQVVTPEDLFHQISIQTVYPLDPVFRTGNGWALLVDSEVVGAGP